MTSDDTPPATLPPSALEFRAFLVEIGHTQNSFARTLRRLGDDRLKDTIIRHIQRMASGEARISGEMRVIMSIMRRSQLKRRLAAQAATKTGPVAPGRDADQPPPPAGNGGQGNGLNAC